MMDVTPLEEFQKNLDAFLKERGIERNLLDHERPFAVISTKASATSQNLRKVANTLRVWVSREPSVTRILGLERMLSGKSPLVASELLMLPMIPTNSDTWVGKVALVVVAQDADTAILARMLFRLLDEYDYVSAFSWEQYSLMNR